MVYDVAVEFHSINWDVDPATLTLKDLQLLGTRVLKLQDALCAKARNGNLEERTDEDLVLGILDEIGELREALKHKDAINIAEEKTDIFFRVIRLLSTKNVPLVRLCKEMLFPRHVEGSPALGTLQEFEYALGKQSGEESINTKGFLAAYQILLDVYNAMGEEMCDKHQRHGPTGEKVESAVRKFVRWYLVDLWFMMRTDLSLVTVTRIFLAKQRMIAEGDLAGKKRDKDKERDVIRRVLDDAR